MTPPEQFDSTSLNNITVWQMWQVAFCLPSWGLRTFKPGNFNLWEVHVLTSEILVSSARRIHIIDSGVTRTAGRLLPCVLFTKTTPSCLQGAPLSLSHHCHGDVTGHLHLSGLFRWLLVDLGPSCHAVLLLQLPAAPAEAPPRGAAEGTVSARRGDGAAQLPAGRMPSCSFRSSSSSCSSTASPSTSTAAQGATAVLPSSDPISTGSSAGSSPHATSKLGQPTR